ncbi:MAG: hypothetical protein ACJAU1_001850 [Psychromonas sp.]|jgi:hypothetical protein
MKVKFLQASLLSLMLSVCNLANASLVTMATDPNQSGYSWANESLGNVFSVNQDIWVYSLGIWDEGADGLSNSYQISLFDQSQNVLASSEVLSGVSSRLEEETRWSDLLSPIMLSSGTNYTLATYRPNSDDLFQWVTNSNVTIASEINLLNDNYSEGSNNGTPIFPTSSEGRDGIFGVNMQYSTSAPSEVPGPSTIVIFSLALLGLTTRKLSKK